ncbi:up-regulator of cell proliferation-like [Hyperolius riggenbachi]|uniref:up-regulator of cell proliferation-like n=1 Tax=Hyperolius riggenbachi TaxID=752182 RepID=UPI0035A285DC
MASTMTGSQTIEQLKQKLTEVFEKDVDGLCDELGCLGLVTQQEFINLYKTEEQREKTEKLMEIILQKGEPACEKFLDHLENMTFRFPALRDVASKENLWHANKKKRRKRCHLHKRRSLEREVRTSVIPGRSGRRRKRTFQELMQTLKMEQHLTSKLSLRDILSISLDNKHDQPKTVADLPWNFLKKLVALNRTARDILFKEDQHYLVKDDGDNDDDDLSLLQDENSSSASIHPLDVMCALLHSSDMFLQQEIVTKMAMCQFAVPLLLPPGDGSHFTLMLWAMRDIVKKWRPQSLEGSKGFREENVVNISMPIFSFVRLGNNKLSKSKILNKVLNPTQQHNDFYIHDGMEGGNIQRTISDGLVEISWYFPSGKSVFPEPIAAINLRGDLESNWKQFTFLTRISSAVFIFIDNLSERECKLFSATCSSTNTQYFFIVTPALGKHVTAGFLEALKELSFMLNRTKSNVIRCADGANEASFVNILQKHIVHILKSGGKKHAVNELEKEIYGLHIVVDKNDVKCQKARELAENITNDITNLAEYKKKTMVLQGELWKELSKLEKELCRMTNQGGKDPEQYLDELKKKHFLLHKKQHEHELPHGIMLFINAITQSSDIEKHYFLKWIKCELDSIARKHLSALQAQYKEICNDQSGNTEEFRKIDQEISDSSLGIEHFLREMGQFYEAECSMVKENKLAESKRQFIALPGIAADLLLDGFPLELIDGDASNIALQWITDVLTQLDIKTGGICRMRVITVLGVQSTGKSTLLNTMFGLQFPVASGRCTRGAFMTILNVKKNFQEELGCEFIMVIDTEGLKAPELASLEGSYEHDNELATLVVGLSDITIVNMAMENTTKMKDILQIVIHAFLRMREVGKKPKCQFVHQNVSYMSAHDKNMRDMKKLLEMLNEMTKIAAEMEKKSEIKAFSDVMDYDLEKDNWYIPGLWLGDPPMAPVNSGYSEQVYELKKYLLEFIKSKKNMHEPLSIPDFKKWVESLWNAVKHEKFIFSFRNSLVATAYNKLTIQFSQWEWEFRKSVHDWLISTETVIKNQSAESLNENLRSGFRNELSSLLLQGKNKMVESIEIYYENKHENVHLIEPYKENFALSTEFLWKELERNALSKCEEAVSIQRGRFKVQNIKNNAQNLIEDKITDLFRRCREKNQKLNKKQLKKEFEVMWNGTVTGLKTEKLQRQSVRNFVLHQLINNMSNKGSAVNQALLSVVNTEESTQLKFKVNKNYIESGWFKRFISTFGYNRPLEQIKHVSTSLIYMCDTYIREKVSTAEDYNDNYCQELLRMINAELSKHEKDLHFSVQFELDIKLHILGRASREFQKMHDTFIAANDAKLCLEKLKPQYLETFLSVFQEKNVCQIKAKKFCERCLKPAMMDHVFQHLGKEIVEDIVHSSDNKTFSSRTFFQ